MIRLVWSVLCGGSVVDKETNALTLFEIREQLSLFEPIGEPGQIPVSMHLVSLWIRQNISEPAKATARVKLLAPGGEQTGNTNTFDVDLTSFRRLRHRLAFNTFPVIRAGVYEFVIEVQTNDEWREVSRVPIEVVVEPASPASTAAVS